MSNYSVYQDDCLELMNNIEDHVYRMILCYLSYSYTNCELDSLISFNKLWTQYNWVSKKNAAIVLFGNEPFSSYLRLSHIKDYSYDLVWKIINFMQAKRRFCKLVEMISAFIKHNLHTINRWLFTPVTLQTINQQ
jgi:site-specific DNA-methyltransferase (adenine-specific)